MPLHEVKATHSAYLALREERLGMEEGYRFLDEKRLILAAEILDQLARHERLMGEYRRRAAEARAALAGAVARYGLEGLSLYPASPAPPALGAPTTRSVLGVVLEEVPEAPGETPEDETGPPPSPVDASPEGDAARAAFRALVPLAQRLAVLVGNLERLRREYTRTARRARAMEDVLLPELDEALRTVAAALEEQEREETLRARMPRVGPP
ncbi:V-type ATP synthase subunit D [Thiococcus pfennigii]|uniref:V-type ATP synthase subunit D n=1 Tax=Thiococcus pfennigii TaxID=1057 RepID=UPI001905BCAE|nr:ATPase [Thiococcus pfennigii]